MSFDFSILNSKIDLSEEKIIICLRFDSRLF